MGNERPGWSERLAVVATSFRRVGFGRLGGFVIPPEATAELRELRAAFGAEELVYLATCNRVECYLLLPEGATPDRDALLATARRTFEARGAQVDERTFFASAGRDALHHLFSVLASLDSLVVGETEISGQARRAVERARQEGLCGSTLAKLFDAGVACARRVRGETGVGSAPVSVASIALQKVRKHFGKEGPGVSLLLGVGDMTKKVAIALQQSTGKVIVANRTRSRAEAFCERHGGQARSLDELHQSPPGWVDLVFTATSAEDPVLRADDLRPALEARQKAGVRRPLIVVDLGMPRDVHTEVDQLPGVRVIDMAYLEAAAEKNQAVVNEQVARARPIVDEEVSRLTREDRFRCLAGESAQAMLDARLNHLAEADRAAILSFVTGLAGRIARQPMDLAS